MKLRKVVEYAGFLKRARAGSCWRPAANTGSFCVCSLFPLPLSSLPSFPAALSLFLRKGKKETGALELDWPHQRRRVPLIAVGFGGAASGEASVGPLLFSRGW